VHKIEICHIEHPFGFTDGFKKKPDLGGMAAGFGGHVLERQHGREDVAMPPPIRVFLNSDAKFAFMPYKPDSSLRSE
jgi:hypothetical protein